MTTKRTKFILLLFCFFSVAANAQVGIYGKRILLKTPLINGVNKPFPGLEIEAVVGRKFSISLIYDFMKKESDLGFRNNVLDRWLAEASYKELAKYYEPNLAQEISSNYSSSSQYSYYTDSNDKGKLLYSSRVNLNRKIYGFSFNFYGSNVVSAPKGGYWTFGSKFGRISVDGVFMPPNIVYDLNSPYPYLSKSGMLPNQKFGERTYGYFSMFGGGGLQYCFFRRLMVDFNVSGVISVIHARSDDDVIFISELAGRFDPNLIGSNSTSNQFNNIPKAGISATIKVGLLLF